MAEQTVTHGGRSYMKNDFIPGRAHFVPAAEDHDEGRDDVSASVYLAPRWRTAGRRGMTGHQAAGGGSQAATNWLAYRRVAQRVDEG